MTKIGIISDTHDNVKNIKKAIELFNIEEINMLIHCGDIVAPPSGGQFEKCKCKIQKFVKGNNDGDVEHITKILKNYGAEFFEEICEFELDGKKIGCIHGDDKERLIGMINSKKYNYIFTGHTHQFKDETIGSTRVINPGGHYYGASKTIAILNVENDELKMYELE